MAALLERSLRRVLRVVTRTLKSNRTLKNLIGDSHNAGLFTNLRAHEIMLADTVRVETYRLGIQRCVPPGSVVLDLGTGTGLLAMFAARHGARKVYAVDHSDFIEVAKHLAAANDVHSIEFVQANSRSYTPPEQVDVILHEQLGTGCFDENMVANLLDLKRRALRQGGRILPGRFELFMEPVTLKPSFVVPPITAIDIDDIDFACLRDVERLESYKRSEHHLNPHDARLAVDRFVSQPEPFLTVDLNEIDDERQLPSTATVTRVLPHGGAVDGFCLYFRVIFDEATAFDTAPLSRYTHWGNRLYRAATRTYQPGDRITYRIVLQPLTEARQWTVRYLDADGREVSP